MLTQICQYLRNWFVREKLFGSFKVENGVLTFADGEALPLLPGQYFRIVGSVFNDGVHKLPVETQTVEAPVTDNAEGEEEPPAPEPDPYEVLVDEPAFAGAVWSMAVPPVIITLDGDIEQWVQDNASAITSPYQSESFGGYSYSVKSFYSPTGGSMNMSWQTVFAPQLGPWRKI